MKEEVIWMRQDPRQGQENQSINLSASQFIDQWLYLADCPAGYWGINCAERCQCKNSGECDTVTGECICPPGYFGRMCEEGRSLFESAKIFNLFLLKIDKAFRCSCDSIQISEQYSYSAVICIMIKLHFHLWPLAYVTRAHIHYYLSLISKLFFHMWRALTTETP